MNRPPDRAAAWDASPSGLLTLATDGTVLDANATFLSWTGRTAADVVGRVRLSELLSVGGRIYWETHLSPMLHGDGRVDEVAIEVRAPDGRLPVLLTAAVDDGGLVRVVLSGARERSRYERELLAARRAADRSATQSRVLQEVTAALAVAAGADAVVDAVLAAATGPLGGAAATVWRSEPSGELRAHASAGEPLGTCPRPGGDLSDRVARPDQGRVVVPVQGQAGLQGVLSVAPRTEPAADPVDHHVLSAVGQQAGLALERALLYEESAEVAHRLQHALLAVEVPADPSFTVTTTYRPGVERLEVGGDWYDAFLVDEGVLGIAVGDVVGHGLGSAIAMGQVRSAVRALAGPGVGPASLLTQLDRFVAQVRAAYATTLAYAEVDLASGSIRYACAGHLPPLVLPRQGEPRLAWEGRSTPLGVSGSGRPRGEAELLLTPGDQMLLYTDGLIERRERSLRRGLELLREAAGELRHLPPDDAVRRLTAGLLRDERGRDDVCALLLSWNGAASGR